MDPVTNDDEFSSAFADLTAPAPAKTPADPPAAPAAAQPATPAAAPAQPAAAPEGVTTPPAASGTTQSGAPSPEAAAPTPAEPAAPAATPTPAAPEAAPTPAPTATGETTAQIQARLDEVTRQLEELQKPPAAPEQPPAPMYTDEENAALAKYREEWSDVMQGEALIRRAEYAQLVQYVFNQIQPHIDELRGFYETQSVTSQYSSIVQLVPDYDQVRDATLAWVDTQPDYLKAAYQQVTQSGTPAQVADLIGRFKRETGYTSPAAPAVPAVPTAAAPAAAPAAPAAPAPAALPAGAAAAAASLRVVQSGRSEPVSAPDPNDFDGAFKEFAQAK